MDSSTVRVGPASTYLTRVPRLGPRQHELLQRAIRNHGSLSADAVRPLTRQGRSLARRELVTRSETGSVVLTAVGRAIAKHLGRAVV